MNDIFQVGKKVDKWLHKLQAERIIRLGLGNEDTSNNHSWSIQEDFQQWSTTLLERLNKWLDTNNEHGGNCNIGDSNDEVEKVDYLILKNCTALCHFQPTLSY